MTTNADSDTLQHPVDICDEGLAEIGTILSMRRNFSMSAYKDKCMKRRIAIRMRITGCNDVASYCHLLRSSDNEPDHLQKTLTIHVSQFFRNPTMYEKLKVKVLPLLLKSRTATPDNPLRVCCLGCACGEEPYSIAILLKEYFGKAAVRIPATIVGVDIDADTIAAARRADYNEERLKDMPAELTSRYFRKEGNRFQLAGDIREMVEFRQGDITQVAGFDPFDIVLCRNTLIYFAREEQEKILAGIWDILPQGGIMILGKSETAVGRARRLFSSICPVERIYLKN